MKKLTILIFLLAFAVSSFAQNSGYMVLSKDGKRKRYYFHKGDEFNYSINNGNYFGKVVITHISDSAVHYGAEYLRLKDITTIKIPKRTELISNRHLISYGLSTTMSYGILQLAYLINTGKPVAVGSGTLWIMAPIPVVYITNKIIKLCTKQHYKLSPEDYKLSPIVLKK